MGAVDGVRGAAAGVGVGEAGVGGVGGGAAAAGGGGGGGAVGAAGGGAVGAAGGGAVGGGAAGGGGGAANTVDIGGISVVMSSTTCSISLTSSDVTLRLSKSITWPFSKCSSSIYWTNKHI